ncbi:MAG: hypothetical protein Q4G03_02090 [Planctomycetia bacterium]|nr:hypothetical protein [Planctomycetia bacterium]
MRTHFRILIALSALCALYCFSASSSRVCRILETFPSVTCVAYGQDDDPFGEDGDEEDPFAAGDDSDLFDESNDADAPDPFAPSTLNSDEEPVAPVKNATTPVAAAQNKPVDENDPRAKYNRPEDVPDDIKTEQDFIDTANAAERSILLRDLKTTVDYFCAATQIARVGRPAFAKLMMQKALDAPDATPQETAEALEKFGEGRAFEALALTELDAVGVQAYERVTKTAEAYWNDETALREAFELFTTASDTSRRSQAINRARRGGEAALALLLNDLIGADQTRAQCAQDLLPFFMTDAVDALLTLLHEIPQENSAPIATALSKMVDTRIALELTARYYSGDLADDVKSQFESAIKAQCGAFPSIENIGAEAYETARGYYGRTLLYRDPYSKEFRRCVWNDDLKRAVFTTISVDQAYRDDAAYWALTTYKVLASNDQPSENALTIAITAVAEKEAYRSGLDQAALGIPPFEKQLPQLNVQQLQTALSFALNTKHYVGALIPVIILREIGNESLTASSKGEPSVIVQAATCPDRRLRFEALAAIVRWNPERGYSGASRTLEALNWFASASGERVVIVAHPKLAECAVLSKFFIDLGYKTKSVTTGRDAILAAQSSPDVEFVYADAQLSSPDLIVLAQILRDDVRTCQTPLMVGASDELAKTTASVKVGKEPNVAVVVTPFNLESASYAVQSLFDKVKVETPEASQRMREAQLAAGAVLNLYKTRGELYDFDSITELTRNLLSHKELFDVGLEFASTIKTNQMQNLLIEMTCDPRLSMNSRRQTLRAFERQMETNGSLLRGPDVTRMYDRYNASETESVEVQKLLSDMLDIYEKTVSNEN